MRILVVTPYYPPEGGGLERYAQAMARELAARGHALRVECFTTAPPAPGTPSRRPRHWRDGDVEVVAHGPLLRLGNAPVHPGFARRVAQAIRTFRPDVVWGHTPVPFPAEMAFRAARRHAVPFVVTYHAGRLRGSNPLLDALAAVDRSTLERAMLSGADALVGVSPYVLRHALAPWAAKASVIPPGVDLARFRPPPGVVPGSSGSGADILFVAPLDRGYRWKGLDVLLAAFPLVRAKVPEARLVLVGDGDRAAELRALARTTAGLVVHGRATEAELPGMYQASAAVALPSTTDAESFGMVLAEAQACGVPVVASDVGGIPSALVPGETGLLVAPGDARALAESLVDLLQDPGRRARFGAAGRRRMEAAHDWRELAARMESVLAAACEATGLPRASAAAPMPAAGTRHTP